jgi:hypothetical protein
MSIIRQNQIRQIREEDNRLRKIVFDRTKAGIQSYAQNIKPVGVLDTSLIDANKGEVDKFLYFLNELYQRLYIIDNQGKQFIETFTNARGNEYRKYLELLNIVKPFTMWEKLMKTYTDPALNQTTREGINKDLIKVVPYIKNITNMLYDTINQLCVIWQVKKGLMGYNTGFHRIFTQMTIEYGSMSKEEQEEYEIKEMKKLLATDPDLLLKEHIESYALYKVILDQIEKNNLGIITKEPIVLEITKVITELYRKHDSITLYKSLLSYFKDADLPELAPTPSTVYDVNFKKKYDELESMNGLMVDAENEAGMERNREINEYDKAVEEAKQTQEAYNKGLQKYRLRQRIKKDYAAELGEEKADEPEEPEEDFYDAVGEGKPKKGRKKNIKRQTKPALGFNDANNEMFYSSGTESN